MLLEDRMCQLSVGADKEKLFSQWNILKSRAESKLSTVCSHFPHFSRHDGTHSRTIATHISNLLGEDRVNKLSYSDIFMMLLSFYYHDIGMALEYEEIYKYFHSPDFQGALAKYANDQTSDLCAVSRRIQKFGTSDAMDYETSIDVYNDVILLIEDAYRSEHAKRSADAIIKDDFLESVIHVRCQKILSDICAAHQKPISYIENLPLKENGFFGDYFHPRLIGAMLCLGDLLDLDTDRFDEIAMNASTPLPQLSKLHLAKHKSVRHFLVDRNVIEVSANMDRIEVYRVMRKWIDWMQEVCDYIALHWDEIAPEDFGNAPRIAKCELLLNGNTKWIPFSNAKYEISDRRMFELLKGSRIYNDKFVCIREIIQNSVDATLLRLFDEEILSGNGDNVLRQLKNLNWEDFQISGEIETLNNTQVSVKIRDRGIGISTDDIRKIANVSNSASAKRKELISKMPMWLRPSGAFGMGLQSIFLLTDQFEVVTKTADECAKKIVFQSAETMDGYITVEDYASSFSQGTEISFVIDGEKLSATELCCSSYDYKQKNLSNHVLRKIFYAYENQSIDTIPVQFGRRKTTDYIPVEIKCKLPTHDSMCTLLEYKPLFGNEGMNEHHVKVGNGYIDVEKFIPDLNCHIIGRVHLSSMHKKKPEEHIYCGTSDLRRHCYMNAIFYRNTFVEDDVLHHTFESKVPIISYMDWRINLLDSTSDEVLKISRNSINEDYSDTFYRKLNSALELIAKDALDYLIDNYTDEDRDKLGDTALVIYQFAVQLDYRTDEFYRKYQNLLDQIKIDGYYLWEKNKNLEEPLIKGFDELKDRSLYFIDDQIEHVPSGVSCRNLDENICLRLKGESSAHILCHSISKVFLGQKDGVYVKAIEARPFEYNSQAHLYQMEDIFLFENLVRMIGFRFRVIPAVDGYETLITPIRLSSDMLRYGDGNEEYYIEMPFADYMAAMQEDLRKDGVVYDAVGRYKDQVIESTVFDANVDYIAGVTGGEKTEVRDKYKKLVKKCLEILGNETYKEFTQDVLRKVDEERSNGFIVRNPFERNPYITRRDIRLDQY